MSLSEKRAELLRAAARLEGHKKNVKRAKGELYDRAEKQVDSIAPLHDTVAEYVGADKGGGILGHRWLRKLQMERARLLDVLGGKED